MKSIFVKAQLVVLLACLLLLGSMPASHADWKQDWEKTVAAANKEGALIVSGPSGRVWRQQLMKFEKDYPHIKLSITPSASRDFWPRVVKEQEVGQYLWDLRVGGPDEQSYRMKAKGYFAPVRGLLLPTVARDDLWYGGLDGLFLDKENKYFLGFAMYEQTSGFYNKKYVPHPLSVKDLVDPQWKGKITMANPRGGSSNTTLAILYHRFGKDFVSKFLAQNLVITRQWRQQKDWMQSGRYPISIGVPSIAFVEYSKRGLPVDDYQKLTGVKAWSQGVGGVQLLAKAPHPNAAKVFINWLLTHQEQDAIMKAVHLNSRRKDVPIYDPEDAVDVKDLDEYIGGQTEAQEEYRLKVHALLAKYGY